jgi:hypothetical protein
VTRVNSFTVSDDEDRVTSSQRGKNARDREVSIDCNQNGGEIVDGEWASEVHQGSHDDIETVPLSRLLNDLDVQMVQPCMEVQNLFQSPQWIVFPDVSDNRGCIYEQSF